MKTAVKTLVVIVGPTAVGKSGVAIELAKKLPHAGGFQRKDGTTGKTEIISADSRQFFKELTIGTAKPEAAELQEVRHHFINNLTIDQEYDAATFGREALAVIRDIFESNDYAILVGGSGLYVKAVCEGFDEIPEVPEEIRELLVKHYKTQGLSWLQQKMRAIDPDYFSLIDQQNPHRLIRALEVKIGTGASIGSFRGNTRVKHDFNILKIGLDLPREELYNCIDERMDKMILSGLFDEAAQLYHFKEHQALQTVGYQEIFDFMDGLYGRDEAIRLLKRNSRRYAKRQLTWFKRDKDIRWFRPDQVEEIIQYIIR